MTVDEFIEKWRASGGSERANFAPFLLDLVALLDLPAPEPATADAARDGYRFERPVSFSATDPQNRGFIDLYRRGAFVMEAKQGSPEEAAEADLFGTRPAQRQGHGRRGSTRWRLAMQGARTQADRYARAVAREDGWPPFLLVVDVGHVIEVFADFSGQGQGYMHFPDAASFRITLEDLRDAEIRQHLRDIWTDPASLDPALKSARVTREVSDYLARLGTSLTEAGHESEAVARYLMRCLFTMFAEDVKLIPERSFSDLLASLRGHPEDAEPALSGLWETMDKGGSAHALNRRLPRFNGGLFRETRAFPLREEQLSILIAAAGHDWAQVEPAIFGTLLERALNARDRHKLGAHYTPRAYVERLVVPTVIEPLRRDWEAVRRTALALADEGREDEARAAVHRFHERLCQIRVLDPACGSANFLYVALELMKRLEGEVTGLLGDLGEEQTALSLAGHTVDPHQFLGIEINPWAAAVAELVLWIGYLQWHFRTYGQATPAEPAPTGWPNSSTASSASAPPAPWETAATAPDKTPLTPL